MRALKLLSGSTGSETLDDEISLVSRWITRSSRVMTIGAATGNAVAGPCSCR